MLKILISKENRKILSILRKVISISNVPLLPNIQAYGMMKDNLFILNSPSSSRKCQVDPHSTGSID